ncbi:MAG: hypothetical protein HOJ35_04965 [Bdellovibrionales bacterium]|jgi:hypothetical protein|nr:hypothetical protein [Bdellovibrionales bacterium]
MDNINNLIKKLYLETVSLKDKLQTEMYTPDYYDHKIENRQRLINIVNKSLLDNNQLKYLSQEIRMEIQKINDIEKDLIKLLNSKKNKIKNDLIINQKEKKIIKSYGAGLE